MRLWERFKAWKRKEVMLTGVSRGRCFVKKELSTKAPSGAIAISASPKIELVGMKVIRADGSIEEIK
jgi:hypothetical protein